MASALAVMVRFRFLVAVALVWSVTWTVKVKTPAAVGVPLRAPVLARVSPGTEPVVRVQA